MTVWIDIAHAPKDGTPVDLWVVKGDRAYRLTNCAYEVSAIWKREGWMIKDFGWLNDSFGTPTHYMEIPKGPNT